MSARLVCRSSSSALRCERSLTVITQARCAGVGERRTDPTETIGREACCRRGAGRRPRTRRRRTRSPRRTHVASSSWRSSGHHGNGVRVPSSCSRGKPVISQMRSFTCTITRPPSGSSSVTSTPSAIVFSTRAVKSRSARTPACRPANRSVTSANVTTTRLELPVGRRAARACSPRSSAAAPSGRWHAHEDARARLAVGERRRCRAARPARCGTPDSSTNDRLSSGWTPIRSPSSRPRMRCALAFAETIRPSQPEHDEPLRERLDDSVAALLGALALALGELPLGDVCDHRVEQRAPLRRGGSVRAAGSCATCRPARCRRCSRSTGPPPSACSSAFSTARRSSGWIESIQTVAGSTPSGGLVAEHAHEVVAPRHDAQAARRDRARGRRRARRPTPSGARATPSTRAGPRGSAQLPARRRPASDWAAVVAATSASSMRSWRAARGLLRRTDQVSDAARRRHAAADRRSSRHVLGADHELVARSAPPGRGSGRHRAARAIATARPDDARLEPIPRPARPARDRGRARRRRCARAARRSRAAPARRASALTARSSRSRADAPLVAAPGERGRARPRSPAQRARRSRADRLVDRRARLDADDARHVGRERRRGERLDTRHDLDVGRIVAYRARRPRAPRCSSYARA